MAVQKIIVDTTVLIEYFRKTDKQRSAWVTLLRQGYKSCISAVTHFEVYSGATEAQHSFWSAMLAEVEVIPFDMGAADEAAVIQRDLRKKRIQLEKADLFIAATALQHSLPVATLNRRHFERVEGLNLLDVHQDSE